jgi:exodeoxyribonuclease V alpha subunit
LVVDEASMMDVMLAYHLLKAVPAGATVVFVGDVNQLPSVGPGNVLKDFIASRALPVVELVEVFRQAAQSEIVMNAHRINRGEVPPLESSRDRLSDFYFLRQPDPERSADMIVDLVCDHIPRRFGLDAVEDIQVLAPMHKGMVGAGNLNLRLQRALGRRHGDMVQHGERRFRVGDKVMQIRNNYEKDVYNGDIGRVAFVDAENRELSIRFDDRLVPYEAGELDEVVMAYAISIHKSQGSEYPAVVIPIMTQHYVMLQRNLIYTAVTRGKRLVVLVGESRALAMAVKNNRVRKRHTWLARRLAGQGAFPL